MSNFIDLFDGFTKPVYVEHTLKLGHEAKNIILVIDDECKKAVFQFNLYDREGQFYKVISESETELYSAILVYLRLIRSTFFKHDPEPFFANTKWYIEQFIHQHIKATFYITDMPFYAFYKEIN